MSAGWSARFYYLSSLLPLPIFQLSMQIFHIRIPFPPRRPRPPPDEAIQSASPTTGSFAGFRPPRPHSFPCWLQFGSSRKHTRETSSKTSASTVTAPRNFGDAATHPPRQTSSMVEPLDVRSSSQTPAESDVISVSLPMSKNNAPATKSTSNSSDTALNALRLTLQALCAVSRSVPLPGINLPFDALLTVFDKITVSGLLQRGRSTSFKLRHRLSTQTTKDSVT
jgi:hypothetical protein